MTCDAVDYAKRRTSTLSLSFFPGDEVLEWNGKLLQNATYDQVYDVISQSKNEQQVELIVSRSAA